MVRIYYKQWFSSCYYNEMFVTVNHFYCPANGFDIVITADEDKIYYLHDIFGGTIAKDKKHLLLAQIPEDIIRVKEIHRN